MALRICRCRDLAVTWQAGNKDNLCSAAAMRQSNAGCTRQHGCNLERVEGPLAWRGCTLVSGGVGRCGTLWIRVLDSLPRYLISLVILAGRTVAL